MYKLKTRRQLVLVLVFILLANMLTTGNTLFADDSAIIFEAENGTLMGTEISTSRAGFSGEGYVSGFDNDGDSVALNLSVESAGLYYLEIGYASEFEDKTNDIVVNGSKQASVVFNHSDIFTEVSAGKIQLKSGTNEIRLVKNWGWFDVDYLKLDKAPDEPPFSVSNSLVNPNATREAKSLMTFLARNYGKNIISGQQDIKQISWVKENTGKYPAVAGFDLMDYSPSRLEFGATSTEIEDAITWWKSGGIVTFCWHWNAPADLINQTGKEWWRGYYTDSTNFDLSAAIYNPDSPNYKLLLRDIDAVAVQLKKLQDAGVPVLWRPLQEAQRGLFWWGAKGSDACKKLYLLMYERLTNYHKLNNLIWVWTSSDNSEALSWYPGDQYVDIIGADIYLDGGDYSVGSSKFRNLVSLYNGKKIVTMSENDTLPDPDRLLSEKAGWSWFCTRGDKISDNTQNSREQVEKVYGSSYVITRDELRDINYNDPVGWPTTASTITPAPSKYPSDVVPATATPRPPSASATATATTGPYPSPVYGFKICGYIKPDFVFSSSEEGEVKGRFKVEIEGTAYSAQTDASGYFEVQNLQYCSSGYTLKISKTKYMPREIKNVIVTRNVQLTKYDSPILMWGGDLPDKGIQDSAINMADIVLLAARFGGTLNPNNGKYVEDFDINMDYSLNMMDVMIIAKHFNSSKYNYPAVPNSKEF